MILLDLKLPQNFEEFDNAKQNGFLAIKGLKDSGERIAGIFCTFTPVEILMAANITSISVCGTSQEVIADAEKELPANLCPLVKSSYGHALTDTCPYIYFSDILIGETTCDGKKKMYEQLAEKKPMHVMHLPNTAKGEENLYYWRNEMVKLKEFIENFYDIKVTEEDIRNAIKAKNNERELLKQFYELGKKTPPIVHGRKLYNIAEGSKFIFGFNSVEEAIKNVIDDSKKEYDKNIDDIPKNRPRIMITGSPMGAADKKIVDVIEELGADLVCFEVCGGLRSIDLVDESIDDVYLALAKKYINIGCSCMADNDNRYEMIKKLLDEYKIDGVIDVTLHACHTFNIESHFIRKIVQSTGRQFTQIETDYSDSDRQQIRTRLEAFIEIL